VDTRPPFTDDLKNIADDMGIALYQRFSVNEASLFLHCPTKDVQALQQQGEIEHIQVTDDLVEFFGYQMLNYLLGTVSGRNTYQSGKTMPDRIIRSKEVQEITGLSRTTLWRLERKGEFPARVTLGVGSVGWKLSEVENWLKRL